MRRLNVKAVGLTVTGAAIGACAGGPIGLAIGAGGGALIDWYRAKKAGGAYAGGSGAYASTGGGGGSLPPGADLNAAQSAVHLLKLNTWATLKPASSWIQTFQRSVGLPATGLSSNGQIDDQTRAMLVLATRGTAYDAATLANPLPQPSLPSGGGFHIGIKR